jgi:hypothetical protein
MSHSRNVFVQLFLVLIASVAVSVVPTLADGQSSPDPARGEQTPVAYASVNELNGILAQLQQTVQGIQTDLGKLRLERWKTDASTKKQTLATVESIQRNLQSGLPETIAQLNNSPEDLTTSFKLYRNLVVLYDSFGSVVENAGAFGTKDEFQNLGNDMTGLEGARRAFGERMQKLAASKEEELTRLRTEVKTLSAAPPPPPTKIVVDDTAPPKKPAKKKVTKPKAPATTTDAPPAPPTK